MTRFAERRFAGLAVAAFAMVLYAPTIFFEKVGLDDDWLWSDTSPLRSLDLHRLRDIFFSLAPRVREPLGGEYLPVRDALVAIDMAIWGHDSSGPHITQLVLFGLLVLGLGTLLVRWRIPKPIAWTGVMLWAAHPLCVQSVAWMSERKGILAALFVVALGHAWARWREHCRLGWLVAAVLCAACAVWSKAPAMFAPAVFAAWDLLVLPRDRRRWIAIAAVGTAALLAAVPVILYASRARVIDEVAGATGGVNVSRPVAALGALGHYAQGTLLVRAPSLSYPIQSYGPATGDLVWGAFAVAAALAVLLVRRKSELYRVRIALLAWTALWFVPFSHLLAPIHILVADRYAFLLLVGPCVGAALALERLPRLARLAATGALVCVLAIATIRAELPWTNSVELFSRGCDVNPRDPQMCEDLADAFEKAGAPEAALAAANRGLSAYPREPHLELRVAHILWMAGDHAGALAAGQRGAESGLSSAGWRYAVLLDMAGRPRDALWWARRSARFHPELESYQQTLATILVELGDYADAEAALRIAVALPDHPPLDDVRLAELLIRQGRKLEVRGVLDRVRADPTIAEAVRRLEQSL